MNAEDLDLLREKILQLCRAANVMGVPRERIVRTLLRSGYEVDEAAVERELRHLLSAEFISAVAGASLTPALARYATTAAGDHKLEKRGLLP
jgi:hypothetical protein